MQTNIEDNVVTLFREKGFEKYENLTEEIVRRVFNQQSEFALKRPFKHQMLMELMNQCRCSKLELTPKGIGETIVEANGILNQRLRVLQGDNGLIRERQILLDKLNQKQQIIRASPSQGNYELHQLAQIHKQRQTLIHELKQYQQSQQVFKQEQEIIDYVFKRYVSSSKKKKGIITPQVIEHNVKNLTLVFYFAVFGLLFEFLAVQRRPGWIAISIYLQALFFIFVGYFHRKAVMFLTLSGVVSIALDLGAIFLFQMLETKNTLYRNTNDQIQNIFHYVYIVFYGLSIIARIGLLVVCYPFMEPPLKRLNFTICGKLLTLNTRLRPGVGLRSSINYQSIYRQ